MAVTDTRLDELRQCGLARHWLRVAERVGVDAFLEVWAVLHEHEQVQDASGRVSVPAMSTYQRFLRNRWIRTLARSGSTPADIQREMCARLGHTLAKRTIRLIISEV